MVDVTFLIICFLKCAIDIYILFIYFKEMKEIKKNLQISSKKLKEADNG